MNAVLWLHDAVHSPKDVIVNQDGLDLQSGDLALLEAKQLVEPFILKVDAQDGHPAPKPSMQISLSQHLAGILGLSNRDPVKITKLAHLPPKFKATQIEIVCKDAYVGRAEMQRMHMSLLDSCAFVGQRVVLPGTTFKARVADLWNHGRKCASAYIDAETEIVFRSQSASLCIFLQISSEAWDFDSDGVMFHEKMADFFLPELFARWKTANTNHVVTLVLFSRIIYQDYEVALLDKTALTTDAQGRTCMDVYKVLLDMQVGYDWRKVREMFVEELFNWQRAVLVDFNPSTDGGSVGKIAAAHEGNVLEAINLACRSFDKRYLDRDLLRTGMSIILVTAGTCLFEVDKHLLRLTDQRMVDMGVTVDCICLSKLPLHVVPVFSYRSANPADAAGLEAKEVDPPKDRFRARIGLVERTEDKRKDNLERTQSFPHSVARLLDMNSRIRPEPITDPLFVDVQSTLTPLATFYMLPPFLDSSFFSRQNDKPFRSDRFMTRVRMRAVESLAVIAECENSSLSLPLLPPSKAGRLVVDQEARRKEREALDAFACRGPMEAPRKRKKKPKKVEIAADATLDAYDSETELGQRSDRGRSLVRQPSIVMPVTTVASSAQLANNDSSSGSLLRTSPSVAASAFGAQMLAPSLPATRAKAAFSSALMTRITAQVNANNQAAEAAPVPSLRSSAVGWLGLIAGKNRVASQRVPSERLDSKSVAETSQSQISRRESSPSSVSSQRAPLDNAKSLPISISTRRQSSRSSRPAIASPSQNSESAKSAASEHSEEEEEEGEDEDEDDDQFLLNPAHPSQLARLPVTYRYMRWRRALDQCSVKWKSLCTPAQLPLYTAYLPAAEELARHYDMGEYFVPVTPGRASAFVNPSKTAAQQAASILKEMVAHRLFQGFQIVNVQDRRRTEIAGVQDIGRMLYAADFRRPRPIYLSYSRHLHRISYDKEGQRIRVKIYIKNISYSRPQRPYTCAIWSQYGIAFRPKETTFTYTDVDSEIYDVPHLDRLISGLDPKQLLWKDRLLFWRTRFLVLPSTIWDAQGLINSNEGLDDTSSEDDIRLAGIIKLFNYFQSSQWNSSINTNQGNISYLFVDALHPSQYGTEELQAQQSEQEARKQRSLRPSHPLLETPLDEIAIAMRDPLLHMKIETKRWHLQTYPYAFTGSDFVDWLVATFVDTDDRASAVQAAKLLQTKGLFQSLGGDKRFADSTQYFYLSPEYTPSRQVSKSWFRGRDASLTPTKIDQLDLTSPLPQASPAEGQDPAAETPLPSATVRITMSTSIVADLVPSHKTDRLEVAQVHLDVVHNPKTCFHFEVNWLGATAYCVDDYVKTLARTIERYGLKLVECPVLSPSEISQQSPLKQNRLIQFAVLPLEKTQIDLETLVYGLLNRLGYLLDTEDEARMPPNVALRYSYRRGKTPQTVFMHSSGYAIIQVMDGGQSLLWSPNRIYASRQTSSKQSTVTSPDALLAEVLDVCLDAARLKTIWTELEADLADQALERSPSKPKEAD